MDEPSPRVFPAYEVIVRNYRRLLGLVGGIGLFLVLVQVLPPIVEASLLASLPMAAFGLVCLWTKQALRRPRSLTYWTTVIGFGCVVATVVIISILRSDILTMLFTVFVWAGPLRALAEPSVRRALSDDDQPRGGLRRRLREAWERLAALLQPGLRPVPVPVAFPSASVRVERPSLLAANSRSLGSPILPEERPMPEPVSVERGAALLQFGASLTAIHARLFPFDEVERLCDAV